MIRLRTSNSSEALLDALAEDLAAARAAGRGLFDPTPLVVPNRQLDAYVKMGVARRNGVAAHITTRYLRGFLNEVAAASEPDLVLVDARHIQGELLALLLDPRRLEAEALRPVREYLAAGGDAPDAADLRRFQLSAELGRLFEEYAYSRPEMLAAWMNGRAEESRGDTGDELESWQRELYVALLGRGGAFEARGRKEGRRYLTAPAFFAACPPEALRAPPAAYVFGISYVAGLYRPIFEAIGRASDLRIYLFQASRGGRGREQLSLFAPADGDAASGQPPDDELTIDLPWGRPGADGGRLFGRLSGAEVTQRFRDPLDADAPTLLQRVQHDILEGTPGRAVTAGDDSITLIPCPDARRELETIAAEIWTLLDRMDPPLAMTDVAIIVPSGSAETYLPLASAVLHQASELPHTIVDAPGSGESRVLEAAALLIGLPLGPLGRQDLLRLATHPAVAGHFPDADPDDWLRLAEALEIVRGADRGDHEGTYVDGDRFNWDQGLRRLALGALLAGRRSGDARPFRFGDAAYLPAELSPELQRSAQGFAILARSLIGFARAARAGRRPLAQWMELLRRTIAATLLPAEPDDEAALARVFGLLEECGAALPAELPVGYRIACELARGALAALPGRASRNLAEGIAVSTFVPMRALPFRVVFLAGMGEGKFPGADRLNALDLRARQRAPGDVTPREQDEYAFLETLLQTRERLYVSYVDRHPASGEELGPCSTVLRLLELGGQGHAARPAPPPRRHEDDAACAVIPAAARERRAAALGDAMRAAAGAEALPEWPRLREALGPAALAAMAPALGWTPPPPAEAAAAARETRATRVLDARHLLRFLQCPLQGSAQVHLPLGDDDAAETAEAAYREHEDYETALTRAIPLLREVLVSAFAGGDTGGDAGDQALTRAYDAAAEIAMLDGKLPAGTFQEATSARHHTLLRAWRDTIASVGAMTGVPAPLWFGHAPEYRRGVEIQPPPTLVLEAAPTRMRVEIHGTTYPLVTLGGLPTSLILLASASKNSGNGRDRLRAWIDHVLLSAGGHEAPEGRRALMLRPNQTAPELIVFKPLAAAQAREYLTGLVTDLLAGVYPYFLPCEAMLGWKGREEKLTDYVLMLRDDGWTGFTSEWGPIPDARSYPTPSEEEAQDILKRRFAPLLEASEP